MGNYRFKLSELMPNAWFYKLRDMGKSRKHRTKNNATSPPHSKQQHVVPTKTAPTPSSLPRKSHYYSSRGFAPDKTVTASTSLGTPRRSGKRRLRHRRRPSAPTSGDCKSSPKWVNSTVSSGCSCRAKAWAAGKSDSPPLDFFTTSCDSSLAESFSPDLRSDHVLVPDESLDNNSVSWPSPCSCTSKFCKSPELQLRPIITKPETAKKRTSGPTEVTKRKTTSPDARRRSFSLNTRKPSTNSPGLRLRLSSPRVSARRSVNGGRRSVSSRRGVTEGTAVVKSSANPQKDFKESMVEMIVKNNIRASKDLEELLACYLSLNSDEYHDIIIKVFKQIWVDLNVAAQLK